ncbi:MAG: MarR family winged helix-turn-helix transcriptional regulator [Segniliparus sp.]|uniref:MarR family winged helix-turn-helix transcriptional regulator n=1 Tax=Segniliparus sp. TaxID=2804064 RepID=UPI003F3F7649
MPEFPLSDEVLHLMRRIMQEHASLWQRHLPELTKPQYAVLRVIGEQPGIEQIAVTSAAAITSATLAEMLGRLVERGLVDRKTDPDDGRRRLLALTEQGVALVRSAKPKADHIDQLLLDRLEPGSAALLQRLLRQMAVPSA